MTSISMYRKWRPKSFEEISGQDHISETLKQGILQNRISHSYLFCGPRGTGKTTTARVLSKAINCVDVTDGNPCNQCDMCKSSNEGKFLDTIELDAASNRGIDEIRSIKEKINFLPSEGSKKVYIIDEAHMLTDQASNAFLKTLEEPPSHVTFILCTTEPQKILPTILSRCQRYDFRKISFSVTVSRLESIIQSEGIVAENSALELIAQSCDGSLRDAETILEQMIVSTNGNLKRKDVEEFVGVSNPSQWVKLVSFLIANDTAEAIKLTNEAIGLGIEAGAIHKNIMNLLRSIMLYQLDPSLLPASIYNPESDIQPLAARCERPTIIQLLSKWNEVNFKNVESGILVLELLIVELTTAFPDRKQNNTHTIQADHKQANPTRDQAVSGTPPTQSYSTPKRIPNKATTTQTHNTIENPLSRESNKIPDHPIETVNEAPNKIVPESSDLETQRISPQSTDTGILGIWNEIIRYLGRQKGEKFNLGALLRDCDKNSLEIVDGKITLYFKNRANFERMEEEMSSPISYNKVREAFNNYFNQELVINLDIMSNNGSPQSNINAVQNSPLIRVAMGMGAHVIQEKSDE